MLVIIKTALVVQRLYSDTKNNGVLIMENRNIIARLFLCLLGIGILYLIVAHLDAIFFTLLTYAVMVGISIFGLFVGAKVFENCNNPLGFIFAIIIWFLFTWLAILLLQQIVPDSYLDTILG